MQLRRAEPANWKPQCRRAQGGWFRFEGGWLHIPQGSTAALPAAQPPANACCLGLLAAARRKEGAASGGPAVGTRCPGKALHNVAQMGATPPHSPVEETAITSRGPGLGRGASVAPCCSPPSPAASGLALTGGTAGGSDTSESDTSGSAADGGPAGGSAACGAASGGATGGPPSVLPELRCFIISRIRCSCMAAALKAGPSGASAKLRSGTGGRRDTALPAEGGRLAAISASSRALGWGGGWLGARVYKADERA